MTKPLFLPDESFSPEMLALLQEHFWCDFGDIFPHMAWDNLQPKQ